MANTDQPPDPPPPAPIESATAPAPARPHRSRRRPAQGDEFVAVPLSAIVPEWDTMHRTCRRFGFGRSRGFELVAAGKIVSRLFGRTRLVQQPSVQRYILSLPDARTEPPHLAAARNRRAAATAMPATAAPQRPSPVNGAAEVEGEPTAAPVRPRRSSRKPRRQ